MFSNKFAQHFLLFFLSFFFIMANISRGCNCTVNQLVFCVSACLIFAESLFRSLVRYTPPERTLHEP